MKFISKCCGSTVSVRGKTTMWYECDSCKEPCDIRNSLSYLDDLTFERMNTGMAQVHYKRRRTDGKGFDHYCAQERGDGFAWLFCSRDGEPAHEAEVDWARVPFPPGWAPSYPNFTEFLKTKRNL